MPNGLRNAIGGMLGGTGLGGLGGVAPQVAGQGIQGLIFGPPAGLSPFPKVLRADDFSTTAVTLSITDFTRIGVRTVGAQLVEAYGQGGRGDETNQGFMRISPTLVDGTAVAGLARLFVANANETNTYVITENRTERLDVNSTDRNLLVPLPLTFPAGREDSLLGVSMKADIASQAVAPTASTFVVPITVWQ